MIKILRENHNTILIFVIPLILILIGFAVYRDYQSKSVDNSQVKNSIIYSVIHIISVYFLYQFVWDINNKTPLPWPVLTSSITPFQFQLFSWWLGICTGISGVISYKLKGNPRWKRFDNYFPINGIFLITASIIIITIFPNLFFFWRLLFQKKSWQNFL